MTPPLRICFIVAVSRNHVIGAHNDLPWRLRCDLQRFKRLTMGHTMLMGRKTYESLPKVLPGRKSIVLTRDPQYRTEHPDTLVVNSWDQALAAPWISERIFVIGGADIFQQFLPMATDIYITHVLADVAGDVTLQPFMLEDWISVEQEYVPADDKNQYPSLFEHWVRRH